MRILDGLLTSLETISLRLVWISGILLIAAAALVTFDVFMRKVFNFSLAGADEISGYVLGISIMLSLSYAMLHRSNIRIDALYQKLPARARAVLDIFGMVLLTAFIAYVAYWASFLLIDTYTHNSKSITPLRTPLAIPQTPWFLGMVFAVFTGIVLILAGIVGLAKGNTAFVNKRLGIPSVDEQIEDET